MGDDIITLQSKEPTLAVLATPSLYGNKEQGERLIVYLAIHTETLSEETVKETQNANLGVCC